MGKFIFISELPLNLLFHIDGHVSVKPCDRLGRATASVAAAGYETLMVGEAAADAVGDTIVGFLEKNGVNVRSIDRFTEGRSPQRDRFENDRGQWCTVGYDEAITEEFDTVWPRIEAGDVIIFGSYFAISDRVRPRLLDLLAHARSRKATIVYCPYFEPFQVPRVTRVMPAVLDNMELADVIITTTGGIETLFGSRDIAGCYRLRLEFYTPRVVNIDPETGIITTFPGADETTLPKGKYPADTIAEAIAMAVTAIPQNS